MIRAVNSNDTRPPLGFPCCICTRPFRARGAIQGWLNKNMRTILLIILILLLIGALPTWPYSSGWGYFPGGGLLLLIILILVLWRA
jgi:hypothetical protein